MSEPDLGKARGDQTRRRRAVLVSAGLLALAAGVVGLTLARADPDEEGAEVRGVRASRGSITSRVLAQGKVRARRQVQVGSELNGRVVAVFVKEGARVAEGDPLFALDDEQARNAVAQLEVARRAARANVTRAELMLAEAERAATRDENLRKRAAIPEEQLIASRARLPLAQADLDAARASVERASLDLERARDTLQKTRVVAPLAGTVVSVGLEVGQVVFPATATTGATGGLSGMSSLGGASASSLGGEIVIADLSDLVAELQVDELDINQVKVGQPARLKTQAGRTTPFEGHVELTGLYGRESGGAVFFPVNVAVELDGPASDAGPSSPTAAPAPPPTAAPEGVPELPPLRPGMTITAEIEVEQIEQTVLVPIAAVIEGDGREGGKPDQVFAIVEEGGRLVARPRDVTLGPSDGDIVAVLTGLQAGDLLVEGPYRALRELKNDDPVRLENDEIRDAPPGEASPTTAQAPAGGAR